jgi:hypothetical protein
MVKFIPIRYSYHDYPFDINPKIQEVTANLGREILKNTKRLPYLSLHTDPSIVWKRYKMREKIVSSKVLREFPTLFKNFHNMLDLGHPCVSILWPDKEWSKEFAGFLVKLSEGIEHKRIKIIEVHFPFNTYCNSLETFLER